MIKEMNTAISKETTFSGTTYWTPRTWRLNKSPKKNFETQVEIIKQPERPESLINEKSIAAAKKIINIDWVSF